MQEVINHALTTFTRVRPLQPTISEQETVSPNISERVRPNAAHIEQTLTVNGAMQRFREASLALQQTFSYFINLEDAGLRSFNFTVEETQSFSFGALRRTRQLVKSIQQTIDYAINVGKVHLLGFTVEQQQAVELAAQRARELQAALTDAYAYGASISRQRELDWTISQLQEIIFTNAKLKLFAAIIEQEQSIPDFYLERARSVDFSVTTLEEVLASFNRFRRVRADITEPYVIDFDFSRLRSYITSVNEVVGHEVALQRLREVLQSISNTLDITFNLSILQFQEGSIVATVSWYSWEAIKTSERSATLVRKANTSRLELPTRMHAALTATTRQEATVIVPTGVL